jgi:autoinducer 2-degrading protein
MHVTLVYVQVKPEHVDEFILATRANHEASVKESGNLRFDVLQTAANPAHFVLYEAYVSPEAAAAHKKTAHYLKWRETVESWMASPRQGVLHTGLFPPV